ncbi:Tex-like protein [Tissierellia bacterium KA00581]|nr:Tex-like protein [Tissierellia bacterium KA00581]
MNIFEKISKELNIKLNQVEQTVKLIDEGNTIPFIARYRKEVTGNLDDEVLRNLDEKLKYLRNLEARKEDVIRLIFELGELTDEIKSEITKAQTLSRVEDIYLPFRPKKRTRATIAKEKGLKELSDLILNRKLTDKNFQKEVSKFINEEKEVLTTEDAIDGAIDIIAEKISEDKDFRDILRNDAKKNGYLISEKGKEENNVYDMYYEFKEKINLLVPHRILAINRGEKEKALKVSIVLNDEKNISDILFSLCMDKENFCYEFLKRAVVDGYNRLLFPQIETEIRNDLKEMADEKSIEVFSKNLKPYIMQSPILDRVVLGIDPGFRTGCKVAVISKTGSLLSYTNIYPTKPQEKIKEAKEILTKLIKKYDVKLIAIGNGTASRETEKVIVELIDELKIKDLFYSIVNEAGASIYSASKLGQEEFPDLDVTVRGAISIARRIQDPMAELVKIEPKHIGVGQYQHDVNQKKLDETLSSVVEDCVNKVGVDVNTASFSLLSYISGISKTMAKNLVSYRDENGIFKNREEIKKVKGIGPKAFTQAAGFLRIRNGENPLDNTAVHPESYDVAKQLYEKDLDKIDISKISKELNIGELTLKDIIEELKRPGRDIRSDMPKPILRSDILSIEDLKVGMTLKGTVRNVVDFGAFVDIGIKNDGLVHISQISNKYIKHPSEVLKVSDIVDVKILEIDLEKQKVKLTMKNI